EQPVAVDTAFAGDLHDGHVVLGYALMFDDAGRGSSGCVLHPTNLAIAQRSDDPADPFFHASGVICSPPALAPAAGPAGFLNPTPDADGILRRMPLLLERDGRVYPGLALAAVMNASDTQGITLRVADVNTTSLTVGDTAAPLDGKSNLLVKF